MIIEEKIYRKMTTREKTTVDEIIHNAEKRKHIRRYNCEWLVKYLLESFKDFNYDEKEDCYDMLDLIFDIAKEYFVMSEKQIKKERKYIIKEYVKDMFDEK
jgi:hypothetical protein